ncbi:hypothetical protein [Nocardioides sp. WS12]|uniref:hypothetical protein n=1 Tax=Nocardioides sp. WS12 TaxID=2486272 RepID=UPI0015FB2E2E|nr:hypothetical protein [Nocardioides sp. WS12]
MELDNPITLRLVIDAGSTPLRGLVTSGDQEPREFNGMLQFLELIDRLNVSPLDSRNPS